MIIRNPHGKGFHVKTFSSSVKLDVLKYKGMFVTLIDYINLK